MMVHFLCFAQEQSTVRAYHQLEDFPFVLIADDPNDSNYEVSDSLFDAASRGIRFRVNSTELQPDDPFIRLYTEMLVPRLQSMSMELKQVFVRGAASPEGPYLNNVRLARERTRRLIDYINAQLGSYSDAGPPIRSTSVTEDYGRLVKMMGEAQDADYGKVNSVWQSCQGDEACCKRRLMALEGGRVWRRLVKQYFPALREARVILLFARRQEPKPEPVIAPVDTMPALPPVSHVEVKEPEPVLVVVDTVPAEEPVRYVRRHLIAARTNLVHDLLYVPQFGWAYGANIQLEYYPLRGHYTMNAGFTFTNHRHWQDYKFFQLRDLQLEVRRYFRGGGEFIGPYLGLYAQGTKYGIGFSKTKGWEGEGGGGGLSVGYTCRLNRKGSLRLELSASFGLFITRYDPYVYGNPFNREEDGLYYYEYYGNADNFQERNHRWTWFGPTNAGIHITYDIIYRKKKTLK